MPEQTIPTDESAVAIESTTVDVAETTSVEVAENATETAVEQTTVETATAEVAETAIDANPHSDLPAAADISVEIPSVEIALEERPLPFGVYRGTP